MLNESLKTRIIDHLVIYTGSEGWEFIGTKIDSTDCMVYRLSSPSYSKDIALKLYHKDKSSKKEPHYSAIQRFSTQLNLENLRYRTPEPYGLLRDDDCFLMEWVTGKSIEDLLWKNFLSKDRQQSLIVDAFTWLNHFHNQPNSCLKAVDIELYIDNIKSQFERLKVEELSTDNPVFKAGFDSLVSYSSQFFGYETQHADIHGDLNLSNLLIDEEHVTGIDIGATEFAPVENDLTLTLNYICITYLNMLTRFDLRKSVSTWEIFNVALDAYKYPKDKKSRDFFLFVFLYQMLRRWLVGYYLQKTSARHDKKTLPIVLLEKWRLRNTEIIVKGLIRAINERL